MDVPYVIGRDPGRQSSWSPYTHNEEIEDNEENGNSSGIGIGTSVPFVRGGHQHGREAQGKRPVMSWPEHPHRVRPEGIRETERASVCEEEAPIIADDDDSTSTPESSADEEEGTSTRSEELRRGVVENDRRYCNDTYFMPNDEIEQTRLSIVHQIFLLLLHGELTKVPVPAGACRILDVGTGPGDWTLEMAEQYPDAEIVATDISVFDSGPARMGMPNVCFQLDNAEDEWTYRDPFDLVHLRGLSGAFRDWSSVYRRAFRHLKPGGYIEIADADPAADAIYVPNAPKNSYCSILIATMRSAADVAGYPRDGGHLRPRALTAVGFEDVRTSEMTVRVGTGLQDPRERAIGKMTLVGLLEGLEARSLRPLTATGNWTADEVRDLCEKVKTELVAAPGLTLTVRFLTGSKPPANRRA
ncbi:S-adenosyl-L-methionine-dependent methyltransferase [Elaphomyces granulatus]